MGRSYNTLKASDITVTPIKVVGYNNSYVSSSFSNNGINIAQGINGPLSPIGGYPSSFLLYRSVQNSFYMQYISGSLLNTGSGFEYYPQSTAASGTLYENNDYRYFPTASDAKVTVISIPRSLYGENIAKNTFNINSNDGGIHYSISDDGNGNLIDGNIPVHVGNILYNQGIIIITNPDYVDLIMQSNWLTVRDGLIGEYYSNIGISLAGDGSNSVKVWYDQSGYGNDLYPNGNIVPPILSSSVFNSQPGVHFLTSGSFNNGFKSYNYMSGSEGASALTVFIVFKKPLITSTASFSNTILKLSPYTSSINIIDQFSNGFPGIPYRIQTNLIGDSGTNISYKNISDNTSYIFTDIVDITQPASTEISSSINNSSSGFISTSPYNNTSLFPASQSLYIGQTPLNIGAILIYNRRLSSSEISDVYSFLSGSYLS